MTAYDLDSLAERLAATAADLDRYIADRAADIAGPRIAAFEAGLRTELAEELEGYARKVQRLEDLRDELRRQLSVVDSNQARLRWAARYLPAPVRWTVIRGQVPASDRPDDRVADLIDNAAAEADLLPYPD